MLKSLCYLLDKEGIKVFPDYPTFWHYDDKLKQKYLFEQLNLPHVPMHAFYTKADAMNWVEKEAAYPFVFKLRGGASAKNVRLVKNKGEAKKLVHQMFGTGMAPVRKMYENFGNKLKKHNKKRDWLKVISRLPDALSLYTERKRKLCPEKGYFLAQDFVEGLDRDYRLKVIGSKCWGFIRYTLEDDFRASGSGMHDYDVKKIPIELVQMAFDLAAKLEMQSVAFDFIYKGDTPFLIEVSYIYGIDAEQLKGYWTPDLHYHREPFSPQISILEDLMQSKEAK